MLCQICNKNPATIHIQENMNGQKQELHLCLECAGKRTFGSAVFNGMDLSEVLETLEKNIEGFVAPQNNSEQKEKDAVTCPECSWTGAQLRKTGRLGCPACYRTFEQELTDRCLKLHRSAVHTGKIPEIQENTEIVSETMKTVREQTQNQRKLENLEQDLRQAVLREEYELAAQLRDQLRAEQERGKS